MKLPCCLSDIKYTASSNMKRSCSTSIHRLHGLTGIVVDLRWCGRHNLKFGRTGNFNYCRANANALREIDAVVCLYDVRAVTEGVSITV